MSNYTDFLRTHTKEGARLRRLYWVYGEEDTFRVQTVAQIRRMSGAASHNTFVLSAADSPETEIWATLNQHPLDSDQQRLVIVHEAQRLKHLGRLVEWVKDNQKMRARNVTAVFISNSPEWEADEKETIAKSSSAMHVRCALPKNEDDKLKRAQEVLVTWGAGCVDRITAAILAKHVNFDMAEAYSVIRKTLIFPNARLTNDAIRMLATRRAEEDMVWALLALDKHRAIEAVIEARQTSIPQIIGTLTSHVEMLSRINSVLTQGKTVRDVAKRLGAREQYVRMLMPYARHYPRREAIRRTLVLARMDSAAQRGEREGVLESLIALW